jgi:hypothetical protein
VVFWYIFPIWNVWTKKNLATLTAKPIMKICSALLKTTLKSHTNRQKRVEMAIPIFTLRGADVMVTHLVDFSLFSVKKLATFLWSSGIDSEIKSFQGLPSNGCVVYLVVLSLHTWILEFMF